MFARTPTHDRQRNFLKACWTIGLSVIPTVSKDKDQRSRSLIHHLLACLDYPNLQLDLVTMHKDDFVVILRLLRHTFGIGPTASSRRLALNCIDTVRQWNCGETDASVVVADILFNCHDVLGQRKEALDAAITGMQEAKKWYGASSVETIWRITLAAQQHSLQGRHHEAIELLKPEAESRRLSELPIAQHASALEILAWSHFKIGDKDYAIHLQQNSQFSFDAKLVDGLHDATDSGLSLCRMYLRANRKEEFIQHAKFLYTSRRADLGPMAVPTLRAMQLHARAVSVSGDISHAKFLLKNRAALQETVQGPSHEETIRSRHDLSLLDALQSRWSDAVSVAARCWQLLQSNGTSSAELAEKVSDNLIFCSAMSGAVAHSVSVWRQYMSTRTDSAEKVLGPSIDSVFRHSFAIQAAGSITYASQFLEQAVDACKEIFGPRNFGERPLAMALKQFLTRNEDNVTDSLLVPMLLYLVRRKPLPGREANAAYVQDLAQILTNYRRLEAALPIWKYAYEVRRNISPPEHPVSKDVCYKCAKADMELKVHRERQREQTGNHLPIPETNHAIAAPTPTSRDKVRDRATGFSRLTNRIRIPLMAVSAVRRRPGQSLSLDDNDMSHDTIPDPMYYSTQRMVRAIPPYQRSLHGQFVDVISEERAGNLDHSDAFPLDSAHVGNSVSCTGDPSSMGSMESRASPILTITPVPSRFTDIMPRSADPAGHWLSPTSNTIRQTGASSISSRSNYTGRWSPHDVSPFTAVSMGNDTPSQNGNRHTGQASGPPDILPRTDADASPAPAIPPLQQVHEAMSEALIEAPGNSFVRTATPKLRIETQWKQVPGDKAQAPKVYGENVVALQPSAEVELPADVHDRPAPPSEGFHMVAARNSEIIQDAHKVEILAKLDELTISAPPSSRDQQSNGPRTPTSPDSPSLGALTDDSHISANFEDIIGGWSEVASYTAPPVSKLSSNYPTKEDAMAGHDGRETCAVSPRMLGLAEDELILRPIIMSLAEDRRCIDEKRSQTPPAPSPASEHQQAITAKE
ncbi:hypothetical protein BDZ85DRAFT_22527 [Elsinoe ampelina]|uniref:Uncharacterized protein n=1 Tax=Elsinoe ampelina TaxID=302913 RepID=A0A6A6G5C7_9PEZI|nr:hypothetical protein BDZ85DRAFT_22527 [Elsinoe ampelina]